MKKFYVHSAIEAWLCRDIGWSREFKCSDLEWCTIRYLIIGLSSRLYAQTLNLHYFYCKWEHHFLNLLLSQVRNNILPMPLILFYIIVTVIVQVIATLSSNFLMALQRILLKILLYFTVLKFSTLSLDMWI